LKTLIFAAGDDQPALLCFHLAAVLSGNERRKTKFQIFAKLKIFQFFKKSFKNLRRVLTIPSARRFRIPHFQILATDFFSIWLHFWISEV
jgi:hypothetical protein